MYHSLFVNYNYPKSWYLSLVNISIAAVVIKVIINHTIAITNANTVLISYTRYVIHEKNAVKLKVYIHK